MVHNPYTLKILHEYKSFRANDLKGTFWICPLDPESRDLFAFEWEDPGPGQKQQCGWAVLPQGLT